MSAALQPSREAAAGNGPEEALPASDKIPVALEGLPETLLIPIAARALDATSPSPILGDNDAVQVMARLDYDFDRVHFPLSESQSIAIRTLNFDRWVTSFLERHPTAVVIQLGCGLDSRARRLNWGKEVTWIDVDLPEAIELHRQVMSPAPSDRDYRLLAADVTTEGWLEGMPTTRPTAVVMEGFLSYFTAEDSHALLRRLVDHFPHGELFLECLSSWLVAKSQQEHVKKTYRKTGAEYKSPVDDVKQFERVREDVKVIEAISFVQAPGIEKLPWLARLKMYAASWTPTGRDAVRLVHLCFGAPGS